MAGEIGTNRTQLGLAAAIASLRAELSQARQQAGSTDIRFGIDKVEVELSVEFGSTREGKGVLKIFPFVEVNAGAGASTKSAHKIKLTLEVSGGEEETGPVLIDDETGLPLLPTRPNKP